MFKNRNLYVFIIFRNKFYIKLTMNLTLFKMKLNIIFIKIIYNSKNKRALPVSTIQ